MKTEKEYLEELSEIRDIMNRSSRFISLSGLSGILAGIYALIATWLAYPILNYSNRILGVEKGITLTTQKINFLIFIATGTLLLSITTGIYLTTRKARRQNLKIWDAQVRRLLANLAVPLCTGGILCLFMLYRGYVSLVAPFTLIFYGLALVNASKYTYREIYGLGVLEIILGLLACWFVGFGLLFWAVGFGLLHIGYGIYMYFKHER